MELDREIAMAVVNLQDAYLNVSIVRRKMDECPVTRRGGEDFMVSDRGRLERLWVALLAVLIEAWQANSTARARTFLRGVSSAETGKLDAVLRELRKEPHRKRIHDARGYMFHRDKRKYWDDGRMGPIGYLNLHTRVQNAFSRIILAGMHVINARAPDL
jgi:hypothetical protein